MKQPLWMPTGSVRSLIALSVIAGYLAGLIDELDLPLLVLGFYFGTREHAHTPPTEE